jgi:hypothetical protein
LWFICRHTFPNGENKKGAVLPLPVKAPSARLEHATYCSASKRSNPLSYEGMAGRDFNSESRGGQERWNC